MTLTPMGELVARRARNVLEEVAEAAEEVDSPPLGPRRHGPHRRGHRRRGRLRRPGDPPAQGARPGRRGARRGRHEPRADPRPRGDAPRLRAGPHPAGQRPGQVRRGAAPATSRSTCWSAPTARSPAGARCGLTELLEPQLGDAGARRARSAWRSRTAILSAGARLPARVTNTSSLLVTLAMLEAPDTVAPVSREVAGLLVGAGPRPGVVAPAARASASSSRPTC